MFVKVLKVTQGDYCWSFAGKLGVLALWGGKQDIRYAEQSVISITQDEV